MIKRVEGVQSNAEKIGVNLSEQIYQLIQSLSSNSDSRHFNLFPFRVWFSLLVFYTNVQKYIRTDCLLLWKYKAWLLFKMDK